MKKKSLLIIGLVMMLVGVGANLTLAAGTWKLCGIVPMSGPVAQFGEYWLHGATLAVEDLKKAGWTGVEIMTEDNQLDPKLSIVGVRRVNMMKDVLMFGTTGSGVVLAIAPLVAELEIPVINVGATSPKIRGESKGWTFSNTPFMDLEAKQAAIAVIRNLKVKTAAVLYVNNEFGLGGREMFSKAFKEAGGDIVAAESYELGATDFRTQWTKIKAAKPDVVYLVSHDIEGGRALKQKTEMAVPIQVIGCVTTSTQSMLKAAGSGSEPGVDIASREGLVKSIAAGCDPQSELQIVGGIDTQPGDIRKIAGESVAEGERHPRGIIPPIDL